MPGLTIPIGGGSSLGGGSRLGQAGPATIAQVAYGGGSSPQESNGVEAWHVFTGVQVAALAWLAFLRYSLPTGKRSE